MQFKSILFAGFFGALLACIGATTSPSNLEERNLLGEVIDALNVGLVTSISVFITLESLTDNLVSINFNTQNILPFELTIDSITSTAGINNTVFASFDHSFGLHPVVVPPLGKQNSGNITNVLLTQGATASLAIIPLGILDLINTNVNVRAGTILGIGGVPLAITGLHQASVPTTCVTDPLSG
ncbi:hypothetical protein GGX14DRAFT_593850 [Mycena pura]|uniref:Uncharacterized protein n=1 Tax=Mycena pura TaxID=153505 RepID=A0AAD6UUS4_9AGAR|nr:hypothetical protein GGX14DRAFT_593850 [Mycena pura]